MKKLFISVLAVAAAVACTKTNVDFEQSAEIGFSPVAGMISKAAITNGVYPTGQPIGIWSNYDGGIAADQTPNYTTNFKTAYLADAKFIYKQDVDGKNAWGGQTAYYWPTNGSLVFAGYSMPASGSVGTSRSYDFAYDKMTITGYTQSNETASTFDLLWFGRTNKSYNYRNATKAVPVTFKHALSWITIKVQGDATSASATNPWKITSVVMNDVNTVGDAELTASATDPVVWKNWAAPMDMTIFTGAEQPLKDKEAKTIETTENGTVVIPQKPLQLTVTYTYKTPADVVITETKTVSLKITDKEDDTTNVWKGGVHYTYTLTFKSNEILVAPTVSKWTEETVPGVTVE